MTTPMKAREFKRRIRLLPDELHLRAQPARHHARSTGCDQCTEIVNMVVHAVRAAELDLLADAEALIANAEALISAHPHDEPPAQGKPATSTPYHGGIPDWSHKTGHLIAATDGSWDKGRHGIGYVISNGQFGLKGWIRAAGDHDPTGRGRILIDELRAVEFLLQRLPTQYTHLTVLLDSTTAIRYLHRWQAGETVMPQGYSLRTRTRAPSGYSTPNAKPTLVRLATRLADLPNVTFQHVTGHANHPLNEAADALARMAARRARRRFDVRTRARDLVEAFLHDWHTGR